MNLFEKIALRKYYLFPRTKFKYLSLSFSQEGEDKILDDFFGYKKQGFYVEVGAHHPQRFSNSYLFYLKGWKGINIDALPGSMNLFNNLRPKDINLEMGVSDVPGELPFFMFQESALNTFDIEVARLRQMDVGNKILREEKVPLQKLSTILDNHLPSGSIIDFLGIDVEGYDLQVLRSNDWNRYRPTVVIVEDNMYKKDRSPIEEFMRSVGYNLFARTNRNSFFKFI